MKKLRRKTQQCPLTSAADESCPLQTGPTTAQRGQPPSVVVVRTERRSWITLAITGFGAILLRYLRTIRERHQTVQKPRNRR